MPHTTPVRDLMERTLVTAGPAETLAEASKKMRDAGCGFLPVGSGDKLEGVITDRDIVIRAIAEGRDPTREKVRDYMSATVHAARLDDTLAEAAQKMCEHGVSRLIVTDSKNKPCGILSFGRVLRNYESQDEMAEVVACAIGRKTVTPQKNILSGEAWQSH